MDPLLYNDLAPTLPLDGPWQFALGENAPWAAIQVPGCWEAQGYSKWLDGPARYRREVAIPESWRGQRVIAEFDAASYAVSVICNGRAPGHHLGLWTPFAIDLTDAVAFGATNTLDLELYKPGNSPDTRYPMRTVLAGFLPDVATTFGGLWQSVRLRAHSAGFSDLYLHADAATATLHVQCRVVFLVQPPWLAIHAATVHIDVMYQDQVVTAQTTGPDEQGNVSVSVTVPDLLLWGPEQPALYTVRLRLYSGARLLAERQERTGFRRLVADGERLRLNGRPICLRGVLSWGWHPDAIAPYFGEQDARAEFRRVRELGFNLIKLCLFVPNRAYFDIADEEGMLLWQEWPLWLPEVTAALRDRAPSEYAAYMQLVHYHPSLVIYSLGCELAGNVDVALLSQLNAIVRRHADAALVCDNSGSGEAYGGLAVDFADFADYHTYGDIHFLESMLDHWRRDWQPPRPLIFGEFCDCDGFRDRDAVIAAHSGVVPWWLTDDIPTHTWRPEVVAQIEAEARIAAAAPGVSAPELVRIAAAQALVVRKYTLETVRRRRQVQGYVITGLRDTPIATSGVFDDLWQPKWPIQTFGAINGDHMLALDTGRGRVWRHGGDRPQHLDAHNWWAGSIVRLHIILNHTAPRTVRSGQLAWQVATLDGHPIAGDTALLHHPIEPGCPSAAAVVEFTLPAAQAAHELQLSAHFRGDGVECENRWPLWSYPPLQMEWNTVGLYDPLFRLSDYAALGLSPVTPPRHSETPPVLVTSVVDAFILDHLECGGAALLLQPEDGSLPVLRVPFWREALKIFAPHPLWQQFPQRGYADLQFWGLASDAVFDTNQIAHSLPRSQTVTPILRRLDARSLTIADYLCEFVVGRGRLLACSLRLHGGLGYQPTSLNRNVAGYFLLILLLERLSVVQYHYH
jgi:hypothetical protein